MHGNITETMVKESDVLPGNIDSPHTDSYERWSEAINLTVKMIKGEVKPDMNFTKMPLLIPISTSYSSPIKESTSGVRSGENMLI